MKKDTYADSKCKRDMCCYICGSEFKCNSGSHTVQTVIDGKLRKVHSGCNTSRNKALKQLAEYD